MPIAKFAGVIFIPVKKINKFIMIVTLEINQVSIIS